ISSSPHAASPTVIYTLSLHDALPICQLGRFHLTVSVKDSEHHPQTAKARVTLVVAHPPTVTQVKSSRGPRHGGAIVTISGTGFATTLGATAVSFGRLHALRVRCRSSVRCTVRTPPGRRGVVPV